MGKPEEARLLYEEQLQVSKEAMRANRETLGDRHEDTLDSIFERKNMHCFFSKYF